MASPVAPPVTAKGPPLAAPIAAPVSSIAAPVEHEGGDSRPDMAFETGEGLVSIRPRRRRGSVWTTVTYSAITLAFLGLAAWGVVWMYHAIKQEPSKQDLGRNYVFTPPEEPWRQDNSLQMTNGRPSGLRPVYRRSDTGNTNAMAIDFFDYETRKPSDAELISNGLSTLRSHFDQLEYNVLPRDDRDRLGDQPAVKMEFQGVAGNKVQSYGECCAITYRGYAYWFITWAPEDNKESAREEWPKLRERFKLLNEREGWKDVPRPTKSFKGQKIPYQIDYADQVWTKRDPLDYDMSAELAMLGNDPRDKLTTQRHESKRGLTLVLVLEPAKDIDEAVKMAREKLLVHHRKGYDQPQLELDEARDESLGRDGEKPAPTTKVGMFEGRILRLQARVPTQDSEKLLRFITLGVVNRPEGVLMIVCECSPEPAQRDFWEQEFKALLTRVKPVKGR
jgi:hypothetical protein